MARKWKELLIKILFFFFLASSLKGHGSTHTLNLSTDMSLSAPRWMYNMKPEEKIKGFSHQLYLIRLANGEQSFSKCLAQINKAWNLGPSLRPWLLVEQLKCARNYYLKSGKGVSQLSSAIARVQQNKSFLAIGAQQKLLRENYVETLIEYFQSQIKFDRNKAWNVFDLLMEVKNWLSAEQEARIYRRAGELAFVQQKLLLAYDYYSRSLTKKDEAEVRTKWLSLKGTLVSRGLVENEPEVSRPQKDISLEASDGENEIFQRMNMALKAGDLLSAVEDGVDIIRKFPSGDRAKVAEKKVLQMFLSVSRNEDKKYRALRARVFKQMKKASPLRILDWGQSLGYRGYFDDSYDLAAEAMENLDGYEEFGDALDLMASSALFTGNYELAEKSLREVLTRSAGSAMAERALFRLGLLKIRKEEYSEAVAQFEKLLAARPDSNYTLPSRYWMWRGLQVIDPKRAREVGQSLISDYPLTYYGLRARYELNEGVLNWESTGVKKVEQTLLLTNSEYLGWERIKILLAAGWFEESQEELKYLPEPRTPEGKAVFARLWAASLDHHKATEIMHEVWNDSPELRTPALISVIYPKEFTRFVSDWAPKNQVSEVWIYSLIKQESSFRIKAVSSAGALGLMQLMPPTAKGVAARLKIKQLSVPDDLYIPEKNIRLGTSYLAQMIRAFDGHLPLALAAYNAGIGRMRRWISMRDDLKDISKLHSSAFRNEIWIDELPWSETSFYVKAILRNILVYNLLEKGSYKVQDPVWQ